VANDAMLISCGSDPFRDSFATLDLVINGDVVQTGPGMTVGVAGLLNGARYLNIATGITANAETILMTKLQFRIPLDIAVALSISQRIINQEVSIELVEVNAAGQVITDTDTAIASAPQLNNARNAAAMQFTGTFVPGMLMVSRSDGASILSVAGTALTTLATGGGPNFIPAATYWMLVNHEDIVWMAGATDDVAALTFPGRRTQALPAGDREYKLRIRVRNGAVAPAFTTDVRVHAVRISDMQRLTVDFEKVAGRSDASDALPVNVVSSAIVPVNTNAIAAAGGLLANRLVSAAATINATVVKAAVGRVYQITGFNAAAATRYLKLYSKPTAPIPGIDVPVISYRLPASAGFSFDFGDVGMSFPLVIGYVLTVGSPDADIAALTAGDIEHLTIAHF